MGLFCGCWPRCRASHSPAAQPDLSCCAPGQAEVRGCFALGPDAHKNDRKTRNSRVRHFFSHLSDFVLFSSTAPWCPHKAGCRAARPDLALQKHFVTSCCHHALVKGLIKPSPWSRTANAFTAHTTGGGPAQPGGASPSAPRCVAPAWVTPSKRRRRCKGSFSLMSFSLVSFSLVSTPPRFSCIWGNFSVPPSEQGQSGAREMAAA